MKRIKVAVCVLTMSIGVHHVVQAQTCATPLPITSQGGAFDVVSGDTCAAANSLPTYGGTGSPQAEIVYSFVANAANATLNMVATGGFAGTTGAMFLMPSPCGPATDPISLGGVGLDMAVNGLTNGQTYYVIATADPGGPNGGCGQYTITVTGTLPVQLQSFSVE